MLGHLRNNNNNKCRFVSRWSFATTFSHLSYRPCQQHRNDWISSWVQSQRCCKRTLKSRHQQPNTCLCRFSPSYFDLSTTKQSTDLNCTRGHSSSTSSSTSNAFDRELKQKQRNNAARAQLSWNDDKEAVEYNYFRQEMAFRLVDRLDDIKREEGFPLALDIGAGPGYIHRAICSDDAFDGSEGGIGGVRKLVQLDSSYGMLHRDEHVEVDGGHRCESYRLHAPEEGKLPFPDGTFDLVLSSQSMHWINDLPGLFKEVKRVLKPDGCFMFSMIGGTTLPELRVSMVLAELEREGGVGAHVGPFVDLSDVGSLLQNAGFALPTIDIDTVRISYPNAAVLMEHLQRMGEGNASLRRRNYTAKDTFLAAACIYDEMFPIMDNTNRPRTSQESRTNDVEASAQVIFAIGWSPHASQQKPLKRGSATHRVGEIVTEYKSGENQP